MDPIKGSGYQCHFSQYVGPGGLVLLPDRLTQAQLPVSDPCCTTIESKWLPAGVAERKNKPASSKKMHIVIFPFQPGRHARLFSCPGYPVAVSSAAGKEKCSNSQRQFFLTFVCNGKA